MTSEKTGLTEEAIRYFDEALSIWGDRGLSKLTNDEKKSISDLLALAVEKSEPVPFPAAESRLALFLYIQGETRKGIQQADRSLEHDPDSFTGQMVRVFYGIDNLGGASPAGRCAVKKEILKLVDIYRRILNASADVTDFLAYSYWLILLGDLIAGLPFPNGRPNLYSEVCSVPISHMQMDGHADEVAEMRDEAEKKSRAFIP